MNSGSHARALFIYRNYILWILISFSVLYLLNSYSNITHVLYKHQVYQILLPPTKLSRSTSIEKQKMTLSRLISWFHHTFAYLLIVTLMLSKDDVINHLWQYQANEREPKRSYSHLSRTSIAIGRTVMSSRHRRRRHRRNQNKIPSLMA